MFKSRLRPLAFALAALVGAAVVPAAAAAGTPTGSYAVFQHCPYAINPNAQACFVATITSGSFTIGNAKVPISAPITLQGGISNPFLQSDIYDAVGAPTLSPTPLNVPGGLLGLMSPSSSWPGLLVTAFRNVVNSANGVTATAESAGPAQSYLSQAIFPPDSGDATVIRLPIRIHLQNPFLGDSCYIGSTDHPIVLNLVANTTIPPPPNKPISGVLATFNLQSTTNPDGSIIHADNGTLVDNSFAAPAATGCGNTLLNVPFVTPLLQTLITAAVNLKEGLPAAAGKNTAIMVNSTVIASSTYVEASAQ